MDDKRVLFVVLLAGEAVFGGMIRLVCLALSPLHEDDRGTPEGMSTVRGDPPIMQVFSTSARA
ncbi:hypothetical protein SIID45300_02161 [Candidatus Magnetaquicoccaceae bacterium FCR-1]|uniref:Secreted protein n=1 Tax=Candidatus Magnetaquiglobus chichijimensis TaxID=3141448 RepID=A0ABQ0CAA5_9PROT